MMRPEDLQSPWLFYGDMNSTFDQGVESYGFTMNNHVVDFEPHDFTMTDDHVDDCGLNTLLSSLEDTTSEICSITFPSSPIFPNDHVQFPINEETIYLPSLMELDDFDSILSAQIVSSQSESVGSFFPSQNLSSSEVENDAWSPNPSVMSESSSIHTSPLTLPLEHMEIDNQVSLPHLMEACGEALEQDQKALAEVLLKCMSQKASPLGESLERLVFYLSQGMANHGHYLKGEAFKNFEHALRALYQGTPIGKVAHFAAISAIVEALPQDCDVVHIVDFCGGHGEEWPIMIEAIAHMHKPLKLTSIKWGDHDGTKCCSIPCNFEDTKRNLYEHAKSCGLKLVVEEKGVEELVAEINKTGGRGEFLVFNCMIDLPHMGRVRSRKHALEFLRVAEDLINSSGIRGMITFGDGGAFEKVKNCLNFKSFFDGHVVHYQGLLESIESHFPSRFSEARLAMEQLFLQPCISSLDWLQMWEEMKRGCHVEAKISLEGCRLSKNVLMEIREVLKGSEGSYQTRIEEEHDNELILEYNGTQLLRFSAWKKN
uniref:Nodulation-signaling pathway 2 protein n=2 Tax=Cajanus cajan TaxID=3821 RepID=A0A151QXR0_CAJCA|nr:Nodulation-signaling pathway 2 protein [Cajanus cajan]